MSAHEIPLYWIDSFADRVFAGNPAAVCPLQAWPDDDRMLAIAAENGLSETAFIVGGDGDYQLRWFTPRVEVDLCGHGTLAAAFVVTRYLEPGRDRMVFHSRSGALPVEREGERLVLDFPTYASAPVDRDPGVAAALGGAPRELYRGRDYLAVFETAAQVEALAPDMRALEALDAEVIVTAPGAGEIDFVSRFFAPRAGIPEDPVTGSAHSALAPLWAGKLGRTSLRARQVSERGGDLWLTCVGDRVRIAGHAVCYLRGSISL